MDKKIIPYKPRPIWKKEIHPALDKYRFAVMVCHRRFGKTVGTLNHIIKKAIANKLSAPRFAYVAPYRNQAKQIAWEYLKFYTSVIPDIKVNESELFVELPSKHVGRAGAKIYVIGADHPDGLRGIYWDGVILDEYANIKPELWGEVIRPALSDREGFAWFIGTPKGQNQFHEIYEKALKRDSWFTCLYRADETGVIPEQELKDMKADMTDMEIRQELYCDFTASASDVLIPIDIVSAAAARKITADEVKGMPVVFGVDVARFGGDRTVIFTRQGLWCKEPIVLQNLDNMEVASRIAYEIDRQKPDAIFIDAGRGEGVIDRLRQLGHTNVIEVPFGSQAAASNRYALKREEMWDRGSQWLKSGGAIPNIPELKAELSAPEYKFDKVGRIVLEPKAEIKVKLGRSPDLADALMLTFAEKVIPNRQVMTANRKYMCNTDYQMF